MSTDKLLLKLLDKIKDLSKLSYAEMWISSYTCPFCSGRVISEGLNKTPKFWSIKHDLDCIAVITLELKKELLNESNSQH